KDNASNSKIVAESVFKHQTKLDNHEQRIIELEKQLAVLSAWREQMLIDERAKEAELAHEKLVAEQKAEEAKARKKPVKAKKPAPKKAESPKQSKPAVKTEPKAQPKKAVQDISK